ncbi:MAG TPA: HAMP domain-containing methyl-accepting chemotaxis protein [Xanthobacteraceae bacterium]|nr:HAMP domain-containing methyl-accepting chemotaxis protein [Xanthobacteraceae bacterium]
MVVQKFNNLPIAIKVFLAPGLSIAALLFIGLIAISALNMQISAVEELDGKVYEPLGRSLKIRDHATLIHSRLFALMSSAANETDTKKRDADAARLQAEVESYSKELDTFVKAAVADPAIGKLKTAAAANSKQYLDSAQQAIETGKLDPSYGVMMMGDANNRFTELRSKLDELTTSLDSARNRHLAEQIKEMAAAKQRLIWIVTGFILTSFMAAFWIGRGIAKPTSRITVAMTGIAAGDLSIEVPDRNRTDEIGQVSAAVEIFKTNAIAKQKLEQEQQASEQQRKTERQQQVETFVSAFEGGVGGIIAAVVNATDGMRGTAENMSSYVGETTDKAASMASSARDAGQSVQSVATATEELSSSIQEISSQITQSKVAAKDAVEEAARASGTVKALTEAATHIGDVISLIQGVASQTNLLALNATIEAARAGEAGRGFAVVAQEVKNLAAQTSRATDEIKGQVQAIQATTGEVVGSIERISTAIEALTSMSGAVAEAITQQEAVTTEIARNASRAASGTNELSGAITVVEKASTKAGTSANDVLASSNQVSQEVARLQQEVRGFLAHVRSAA